MSNKQVAELLETTMCNAGIMDDYDEIIWDVLDNDGLAGAREYHANVLAGVAFINKHSDDSNLTPESFTGTFNEVLEEKELA